MPWKVDGQKQNTFYKTQSSAGLCHLLRLTQITHLKPACFHFENSPLLPELLVGGLWKHIELEDHPDSCQKETKSSQDKAIQLQTPSETQGKGMTWPYRCPLPEKVELVPEWGDPGKAQRDLDGVLLLLRQSVSVRVGKMGSHICSGYFQASRWTISVVNLSRFQCQCFQPRLGEDTWGRSMVARLPPPPPPLATRAALQPPPASHTGQVDSCVLSFFFHQVSYTIAHKYYQKKYFEMSSSCVHFCPEPSAVTIIHKCYQKKCFEVSSSCIHFCPEPFVTTTHEQTRPSHSPALSWAKWLHQKCTSCISGPPVTY